MTTQPKEEIIKNLKKYFTDNADNDNISWNQMSAIEHAIQALSQPPSSQADVVYSREQIESAFDMGAAYASQEREYLDRSIQIVAPDKETFINSLKPSPVYSGWVSVEEGFPDERYDVYMVFNGNDPETRQHIRIASWFNESKEFKAGSDYQVTHYMPLPSTPH